MRTVNGVSKMTGVSIRTLHYYDQIGLLSSTSITEAGYRLYDDTALERLQHIMLFWELLFPLKDIGDILNASNFGRNRALEQQIQLLTLKKEYIENLITFARGILGIGVKNMKIWIFQHLMQRNWMNMLHRQRHPGAKQKPIKSLRKKRRAAAKSSRIRLPRA